MKKVVVALDGGLGNQMFQYAAGRALASRTSAPLVLDLRPLLQRGHRPYGLSDFAFGTPVEMLTEGMPPRSTGRLRRFFDRLSGGGITFHEAGFPFDGRILHAKPPVRLEGYFQSERYFMDSAATIRADFTPKHVLRKEIEALANRLLPTGPSVSLHIRRGDYTDPQTMAVHGLLGPDYYAQALRLIAEQTSSELTVCVFTDDPAWVRAHLPLPASARYISEHTRSALQDLMLMSHCSHHITANSSFSWWGAWLNPNKDKIVVTPKHWFQPSSGLDTRDLRPASWLTA